MTRPKNPHKLAATRRKAGAHSGARRPADSGCYGTGIHCDGCHACVDTAVCPSCQFEARNGHSPACSGEENGGA